MKAEVLARYTEVSIGPVFVDARLACALCGERLAFGARAVLLPANAREVRRMCWALPYCGSLAHRACLKEMP